MAQSKLLGSSWQNKLEAGCGSAHLQSQHGVLGCSESLSYIVGIGVPSPKLQLESLFFFFNQIAVFS